MSKRSVRIALFLCDTPNPLVLEAHGTYLPIFTSLLADSLCNAGLQDAVNFRVDAFDVVQGELPDRSRFVEGGKDAFDAILMTGSGELAWDVSSPVALAELILGSSLPQRHAPSTTRSTLGCLRSSRSCAMSATMRLTSASSASGTPPPTAAQHWAARALTTTTIRLPQLRSAAASSSLRRRGRPQPQGLGGACLALRVLATLVVDDQPTCRSFATDWHLHDHLHGRGRAALRHKIARDSADGKSASLGAGC